MVRYISFFRSRHENMELYRWYWDVHCFPVGQRIVLTLTLFVIYVLGFLPWCKSNGLTLSPIYKVNWIPLKTRLMLLVQPISSSKLAMIKFFSVLIARSTTPAPVCSLGGLYSFSTIFSKTLSLDMQAPPLSDSILSGTHQRLIKLARKWMIRLVWFTYLNYGPLTISINSDKNVRFIRYMFII